MITCGGELSSLGLSALLPTGLRAENSTDHKESEIRILCLLICVNYLFNLLIESGTFYFLECSETPVPKGFHLLRLDTVVIFLEYTEVEL